MGLRMTIQPAVGATIRSRFGISRTRANGGPTRITPTTGMLEAENTWIPGLIGWLACPSQHRLLVNRVSLNGYPSSFPECINAKKNGYRVLFQSVPRARGCAHTTNNCGCCPLDSIVHHRLGAFAGSRSEYPSNSSATRP